MGFPKNVPQQFVYDYDFSRDGGAVSDIALTLKGVNGLTADLVITDVKVYVSTALTSGGSATVTMGNAGDRDGYFVDFFGAATPAGAVINRGDRAGALVWDDTNDHPIDYKPVSADAAPSISIGTAALTAGAFKVVFTAYRP
jgi:hypothetical protein